MRAIGLPELIVIAILVLVLFGGKRLGSTLSEAGKGIGEGLRAFRSTVKEADDAKREAEKL